MQPMRLVPPSPHAPMHPMQHMHFTHLSRITDLRGEAWLGEHHEGHSRHKERHSLQQSKQKLCLERYHTRAGT